MAGRKASLKPMWKRLGELIELEPAVPMDGNVYLGCGQQDVATNLDSVRMIREAYFTKFPAPGDLPEEEKTAQYKADVKQAGGDTKAAGVGRLEWNPKHPIITYQYTMCGHCEQTVQT